MCLRMNPCSWRCASVACSRTGILTSSFSGFPKPFLKRVLRLDGELRPHPVMAETTQLRTSDLILAGPVRNEPDLDLHARNGILFHPLKRQVKTVDHVVRTNSQTDGLPFGKMELIDR